MYARSCAIAIALTVVSGCEDDTGLPPPPPEQPPGQPPVTGEPPAGPPPTLIRRDAEPPGPNCFHGGTAVRTGADINRDGALEDVEVEATTYACTISQLFDGNFTPAMWSDPAAVAALGQAHVVTGSLAIASDAPVSLPTLELVGGDLVVTGAGVPGGLALPALTRVGGALTIPADAAVIGFQAPLLAHIGGDVTVRSPAITTLELPALRTVGSIALTDLAVSELELPALTTVLGELALARLNGLALLDLSALRSIGQDLTLQDLPALGAIDLPVLGEAVHLFIFRVQAHALRLPSLSLVEGELLISDSPVLRGLALPVLTAVGGALMVARCPNFESLDAPVLDSIGEPGIPGQFALLLDQVDLPVLSLPRLRSAPGGVQITASWLQALDLPALTTTSRLQLQDDGQLATVALPALRAIDAAVLDARVLRALALDALTTVAQRLEIRNTLLVDLHGLGSLRAIGDRPGALANLVIDGNAQLASLAGLERLATIGGKLTLTGNAKLASLAGLAGLTAVGGAITATGDPALSPDEIAALIARVHP